MADAKMSRAYFVLPPLSVFQKRPNRGEGGSKICPKKVITQTGQKRDSPDKCFKHQHYFMQAFGI